MVYVVTGKFIKLSMSFFYIFRVTFCFQVFRLISLWFSLSTKPIVVDSMISAIREVYSNHCYESTSETFQCCIFQNILFCICIFYICSRLKIIRNKIFNLLSGSIFQVYTTSIPNCFQDGKLKRRPGSSKVPGITCDFQYL